MPTLPNDLQAHCNSVENIKGLFYECSLVSWIGYYGNADGEQTNCSWEKEDKDPSAFSVSKKNSHFKAINFVKDQ